LLREVRAAPDFSIQLSRELEHMNRSPRVLQQAPNGGPNCGLTLLDDLEDKAPN